MDDESYHKYVSPFLDLINVDMFFDFPLDPMHLVYLGVVKRYLTILYKGDRTNKSRYSWKKNQRKRVNMLLQKLRIAHPFEFHRKRRSMEELSKWKAVEFRSFLLYVGPIVLKQVLGKERYEHFLNLHVAIRLLTSENLTEENIRYADELLKYFVDQFEVLYGDHHLVYNIHSLSHLANDCRVHGSLESFSTYPFESFLGSIKGLIRSGYSELAQIARRLSEYDAFETEPINNNRKEGFSWRTIIPSSKANAFCMLRNGLIVKVTSITDTNIFVQTFLELSNYYTEPIESSKVGVYQSSH